MLKIYSKLVVKEIEGILVEFFSLKGFKFRDFRGKKLEKCQTFKIGTFIHIPSLIRALTLDLSNTLQ